jgi:predicted kinase
MSASGPGGQPVLVVMGVSGSGKSTVAGLLAARLGWDLQEGDDRERRSRCVSAQVRAGARSRRCSASVHTASSPCGS